MSSSARTWVVTAVVLILVAAGLVYASQRRAFARERQELAEAVQKLEARVEEGQTQERRLPQLQEELLQQELRLQELAGSQAPRQQTCRLEETPCGRFERDREGGFRAVPGGTRVWLPPYRREVVRLGAELSELCRDAWRLEPISRQADCLRQLRAWEERFQAEPGAAGASSPEQP